MIPEHAHGGGVDAEGALLLLAASAVLAYAVGMLVSRRRGRSWPLHRLLLWTCGVVAAAVSVVGPLAHAAHEDFVAHMQAHLAVGMLAPLLLALAAPVTLALRSLDVTPARRLSRLLSSAPAQAVAHPVTAAALNAAGLALLYLTPLYEAMQNDSAVHLLVHGHLLIAGYLLAAAVVGSDPQPHGPRRVLTAVVLVLSIAAHSILAKWLYAHPPVGVPLPAAEQGSQLMYYGGALVEGALIVVFCARWYAARGRRMPSPESASFNR